MSRIGFFSSGRDRAARDLLKVSHEAVGITFVFINREGGENEESDRFLGLAEHLNIPRVAYSSKNFKPALREKDRKKWRREYDREVLRRLKKFPLPHLLVLAGYMLIIGEEICQRYPIINLHPAAPGGPIGTWQNVIWKLIEVGAEETGVMMHLVTPKLDEGPPITYCTFSIKGESFDYYWEEIKGRSVEEIKRTEGKNNPLFKLIRQYGLAREILLIEATLKAFAEGRIRIKNGQALDKKGRILEGGYNLSSVIDERVKQHFI